MANSMAEIPYDEETTRDWDWFAVDCDGHVGHFTTGAFRLPPRSVKADWARAEELIALVERLPETCGSEVRPEFWKSEKAEGQTAVVADAESSERYFRSFATMARKGLFSYDTELKCPEDYFGVTAPKTPITVEALPESLRRQLCGTVSTVRFRDAFRIPEDETLGW